MYIAAEINQRLFDPLLAQVIAYPVGDISFGDCAKVDFHSGLRQPHALLFVIENDILRAG
ncbi:hypothetical protein A3N52_12760 [Klebsiella aerogenes]|nr:hypothetical protein A3N45_22485 [Klebsiella aerogenes]KZQ54125.1 hypothetical protein A3N61_13680 [Klebsiella aerogenes]KZQ74305.1 hypothetical protein A3N52_12760 [Klebsiella aerogenes]